MMVESVTCLERLRALLGEENQRRSRRLILEMWKSRGHLTVGCKRSIRPARRERQSGRGAGRRRPSRVYVVETMAVLIG